MRARRLLLVLATLVALMVQPAQVLADSAPTQPHTTVLFVGGYGSTLAGATLDFAPLRAALTAHDPTTAFAQYSYLGWNVQTCRPLEYSGADTGQDFAASEQQLLTTIYLLRAQCGVTGRIVVVGHSLGGLVAFHALSDNPMSEVTDVVTIDSPLGGAPATAVEACVDSGVCADGPVRGYLANLYNTWDQTARDNAARVGRLGAAGIRVTAWGNEGDCLYAPAVCVPLAAYVVGNVDVRDTQWLGVANAERLDFTPRSTLASVLNSHQAILTSAATQIVSAIYA
ncbi:MAG: alpha/beta fold hydrolase [Chloroflexi bacterium]|nr:alpha/beta fold hydrolase [Chloroflexota bacterium]MBV9595978.1 alpha/beta fold hydrolase [Chloroflexota bacterium]